MFGVGEPRPQDSHITWTLKNDSDVLKTDEGKFHQGQTLIFEAKPDEGYRLTEVNGFDEAEANEDGTWTCVICAINEDITVSALVSELYDLTCVQPENGTVAIDKTQAIERKTVTVTATLDGLCDHPHRL